jgi:hypothetical protein
MSLRTSVIPFILLFMSSKTTATQSFAWTSVAIGGGGFVSSIVISPV